MIGQNLKSNQDKKPNSREMEKLKKEFPQFFTKDGEFKIDNFKDFLKEEEVELSKEGYGLEFLGKSYAKYLSSLESETYISPDLKHNEKDENKNSENLYIVGDNIDALKHLLGSYSGKIKCIYIDPPYNTGSDGFVYPDNFNFDSEELARTIGITEEEAERILNLSGKSTHSAWLTFIYPRLLLARDLLADDGVIFISIDYNEQANLKLICDEIFGEENFVGEIYWESKTKSQNTESSFNKLQPKAEKIFTYKKKNKDRFNLLKKGEKEYPLIDENGKYREHILEEMNSEGIRGRKTMIFDISDGVSTVSPTKGKQWKLGQDQVAIYKNNNSLFIRDNKVIIKMRPENERSEITEPFWGFIDKTIGTAESAKKSLKKLMGQDVFDTVKPTDLIKKLIFHVSDKSDSIILDFFSGSATTADALMQLNAEDGGKRKYIMVQIPEKIDKKKAAFKAGYKTIDEIGRERIKRAGKKIKNETGADIDYGFKLFYLEKPEEKTLDELEEFSGQLDFLDDDMVSIFDNDHASGKENILSTWLNEDGYGLSESSDEYVLDEYRANLIGKSLYIIDSGLGSSDVMELIRRIEDDSLLINRIVVYLHSIDFSVLQELRTNLSVLRNNKNVSLIERF
ncbi:MAG: DNA methyltransferase [Anaerococcus vaginalis]|nr:DNA methyltransferase [Anaerococcus vaginalis]